MAAPAGAPQKVPVEVPAGCNRVTVWNRETLRKISGKAAPMEKNLDEYLRRHPECELYGDQDAQLDPAEKAARFAAQNRVAIWNKTQRRRVSGNAAPSEKKLAEYLRKHPDCEVYNGQDKSPGEWKPRPREIPQPAATQPRGIPTVPSFGDGPGGPSMAGDLSFADMYMEEGADVSLDTMSGRSLEDMLLGMSIDSNMEGISIGGSVSDFLSGTPWPEGDGAIAAPGAVGGAAAQPIPTNLSSAQRIKRDRATSRYSMTPEGGSGSLAGSALAHPAQRMKQGPGPGSLGTSFTGLGSVGAADLLGMPWTIGSSPTSQKPSAGLNLEIPGGDL